MKMKVVHEPAGKKGAFYLEDDGSRIGELLYFHFGKGSITIYHTEVDEKYKGQSLGRNLVEAAVAYARQNDVKIVAECPYAKHVIDTTPEFQDVLAK